MLDFLVIFFIIKPIFVSNVLLTRTSCLSFGRRPHPSTEGWGRRPDSFIIFEFFVNGTPPSYQIYDPNNNPIPNPSLLDLETFYIKSINPQFLFNF